MSRALIGQLLGRIVPLSEHDVDEILEEQKGTSRRFGEIAMAWGLCESQHIWKAWCRQTGDRLERIDLGHAGVDTQAMSFMSRQTAIRHTAIPVRSFPDLLVVAVADPSVTKDLAGEMSDLGRQIKFVLADPAEIEFAIVTYYQPAA